MNSAHGRHMFLPDEVEVRCPACGGRARFDRRLFDFTSRTKGPPVGDRPVHRWSSYYVVERYPSLAPWVAPRPRRPHFACCEPVAGALRCMCCHLVRLHEITWPADAYWRWEIRGATLWA